MRCIRPHRSRVCTSLIRAARTSRPAASAERRRCSRERRSCPDPGRVDRGYRSAMPDPTEADAERWLDLEVKLAYQERLIHELDKLVREFGARLDEMHRELAQLK